MGLKIVIPVIIGVLLTTVIVASAQGPPSSQGGAPLNQILSLLNDPTNGLAEIKAEIASIEGTVNALDLTPLGGIATLQETLDDTETGLPAIKSETDKIQ